MYKSARIMVIDDEMVNLKLLGKLLTAEGYTSFELIQDPREVITRYQAAPTDLILLDIRMPHLTGFEVMEQLNALNDPMLPPIVIMTAQPDRSHLIEALARGARDFIGKPFDRTELIMRVRNMLDAQRSHRLLYDQKNLFEHLVHERTEEVRATRLQVVHRLGKAAEYRDNETGNHILRVSYGARVLALALGWSAEQAELLLHAAPMHDIGKIGIPDSILLKPGPLTDDERQIMQTHTQIGAELLSGDESELLILAREIAMAHHERWDGSGYPLGLAGEAISEAGRIVAIVDVFDALTSKRPYKDPWPLEKALALIRESSGTHFDPGIVELFFEKLPEVLAIQQEFLMILTKAEIPPLLKSIA